MRMHPADAIAVRKAITTDVRSAAVPVHTTRGDLDLDQKVSAVC